jgi:hypothetical protein
LTPAFRPATNAAASLSGADLSTRREGRWLRLEPPHRRCVVHTGSWCDSSADSNKAHTPSESHTPDGSALQIAVQSDHRLISLIDRWPKLPESTRARILSLIGGA